MGKLVLLVVVLLLAYWFIKGWRRLRRPPPATPRDAPETMVPCAHCGLHVPRGESLAARGQFFCTTEHQRAHEGRQAPP